MPYPIPSTYKNIVPISAPRETPSGPVVDVVEACGKYEGFSVYGHWRMPSEHAGISSPMRLHDYVVVSDPISDLSINVVRIGRHPTLPGYVNVWDVNASKAEGSLQGVRLRIAGMREAPGDVVVGDIAPDELGRGVAGKRILGAFSTFDRPISVEDNRSWIAPAHAKQASDDFRDLMTMVDKVLAGARGLDEGATFSPFN